MGSSSQTQKTDTGPWGPTQGPLTNNAIPRIEQSYQNAQAGGDPLSAAKSYANDVLGGQYLDPSSNPYLGQLSSSIWGQVAPQIESVFSRAGRGTSASASGLAGALSQGFTSALAQPLFNQYNTERGLQSQAVGQQAGLASLGDVNLNQYLSQMGGLASLGQKGQTTTTSTPSGLQMGLGAAMGLGSLFAAPAGGTSAIAGLMALSDRRVKTDIRRLGADERGLGVYGYRYKWDRPGTRHIGVMADEAAVVAPEAVDVHPSGALMVDYAKLGGTGLVAAMGT
jgi:hypothetical protein